MPDSADHLETVGRLVEALRVLAFLESRLKRSK
jgi:hypothetical protein